MSKISFNSLINENTSKILKLVYRTFENLQTPTYTKQYKGKIFQLDTKLLPLGLALPPKEIIYVSTRKKFTKNFDPIKL